jgi:hypothetical protein
MVIKMHKEKITISIEPEVKKKLILDFVRLGYSSKSSYINELIKRGLPVSESLDIRLQLIEKKVDTYTKNLEMQNKKTFSLLKDVFKRVHISTKVVFHILTRTFFIKSGQVPGDDISDANELIEEEVKEYEEQYERK